MGEKISINTPFIKLDSFLKFCGVAMTGGHAKDMVVNGEVLVDGAVCLQRGKKLYPGAIVAVEGQEFEVTASEG